jgi:hypothetical protein
MPRLRPGPCPGQLQGTSPRTSHREADHGQAETGITCQADQHPCSQGHASATGRVWLLATVSGEVGEELSVTQEFGSAPRGFGGDVFIYLTAGADTWPHGSVNVQVLVVADGALVTVNAWESLPRGRWLERNRPSVVFAASVLIV